MEFIYIVHFRTMNSGSNCFRLANCFNALIVRLLYCFHSAVYLLSCRRSVAIKCIFYSYALCIKYKSKRSVDNIIIQGSAAQGIG